jgi:hypothetical protein
VKDLEDTITLLKRVATSGPSSSIVHMQIKMKETKPYDRTCNAKLLGNLCWDMEQYLEQLNVSLEEAKVNIVAMFLTGL